MRTLGCEPGFGRVFICGARAYGALIRAQPVRFKPRRRPSPTPAARHSCGHPRPGRDLFRVALAIVGIQRARGFLESGQVAGQAAHEEIGGFLPFALAVADFIVAARLFDQLAQRHRRAAGLRGQPVPVARQQRHFARHHAQLGRRGARASGGVVRLWGIGDNWGGGAWRATTSSSVPLRFRSTWWPVLSLKISTGADGEEGGACLTASATSARSRRRGCGCRRRRYGYQ